MNEESAYCALLRRKIKTGAIRDGRKIHEELKAAGSDGETFPGNLLVQLYGECGCLDEALLAFRRIIRKNVFSWTALMGAHNKSGCLAEVRDLLARMPCHNAVALTAAVVGHAQAGHMDEAKILFDSIPDLSVVSCNEMINAYGQNGFIREAETMFDQMPESDVVSWNTLMQAFAQNGYLCKVLEVFTVMDLEGMTSDQITLNTVIDACTDLGEFSIAKISHSAIKESPQGLQLDCMALTSIINMYGKCNRVEEARQVFDEISSFDHDVVSWTAIITVNGHPEKAIEFFRKMVVEGVEPNRVTFVTVFDSCAELGELETGRIIHGEVASVGVPVDIIMGTALVKLYGSFGCWEESKGIFEMLSQRDEDQDVVLCNAMISTYALNGFNTDAMELFWRVNQTGMKPDKASFVAALDACANSLALKQGKILHSAILERGFESDLTALVNFYGKCGNLISAKEFFMAMKRRSFITWNAMMGSFAENGHWMEACGIYREMELEGFRSDQVTFLGLLFASSHAGLQSDALGFFYSLQIDYGLRPGLDHYRCLIDLLGRLGQLQEAEELLSSMPFEPDANSWMALLGSCKTHGDVARGGRAARAILQLDPRNFAACRLWSSTLPSSLDEDMLADVTHFL